MRRICTKKEFQHELDEAGDRLIAVDFTADWCTKTGEVSRRFDDVMFDPEFSEVIFLQVDVDDNEDTPPFCDVGYLPTIQFFRYGKKVGELYEDTLERLKELLRLHR